MKVQRRFSYYDMVTAAAALSTIIWFARLAQYVEGSGPAKTQATCVPGETTTTVITYGDTEIMCPEGTALAQRRGSESASHGLVLPDDKGSEEESLRTLYPAAFYIVDRKTGIRGPSLLMVKSLDVESHDLYFHCRADNNKNIQGCYIHIKTAAAGRLGPNACLLDNEVIRFHIQAPKETVQFTCSGRQISPDEADKAYDSKCQTLIDLKTVAPGAQFQPSDKATGMHRVYFPKQPPQFSTLCYTCGEEGGPGVCTVFIDIDDAAVHPSSAHTGKTTRTASALFFLFVGVSVLHAH